MKTNIDELAIFGGKPEFVEPLHVGRPNIGNREHLMTRINDVLDQRWLTNNGPFVQEFEKQLASITGARHCIAICNATVALEIAIRALGLKGEVIVPSFTFIATAHALQWQEITPVFCDVDPDTHNINPFRVEELITPRTSGVIGVHLWGRPCDIDSLQEITQRRGIKLLFDAAHAFGSTYKGRQIGNFGDAEVFSFHATKFLNTFEGGAIATNDDELAKKIHLMKNFGFAGYDNVVYIGTNGKMNELSAAMGITSLECMSDFISKNHHNYRKYRQGLKHLPGLKLIQFDKGEKFNYQYIVLEMDEAKTGLSRDDLIEVLHAENVLARRYFFPGCHRMEPYRSYFPHAGLLLPVTERLVKQVFSLPNGTAVSDEDIDRVTELIRMVILNGSRIKTRLDQKHKAAGSQEG